MAVVLSCPEGADERRGRISVLDPLATALMGAAAGEAVRWTSDDGRTRVVEIAEVGRAGQRTA